MPLYALIKFYEKMNEKKQCYDAAILQRRCQKNKWQLLYCFIQQNHMDDSDPLYSSKRNPNARDKKKKYVQKFPDQKHQNFTRSAKSFSNFNINSNRQQPNAFTTNFNLQINSRQYRQKSIQQLHNQSLEIEDSQNYRNCKEKIDDKSWLNVLKKYVKKVFTNAKNIEIYYDSTKPSLMFHFSQHEDKVIKKMPLKDIIKVNKKIGRHECETIEDIFDRLFFRVSQQFHKLMELVMELADIERVDLYLPSKKYDKIPMLYYCVNKHSTNFTLFDMDMKIFEFNDSMIKELNMGKKQQKLWQNFEQIIENKRRQDERVIEQHCQYEASSDQQEKHKKIKYQQKIDVSIVKKHIRKITQMNLDEYEDEISELQQQFYQLRRRDDHKSKAQLQKLADDLGELQSNLENFKQTSAAVEKQMQGLRPKDSQRYTNLLKKMILAKKQLENKLPITAKKREIFNALDKDDIIILEGETGSGKSTQLPQMMCEYFRIFDEKGKATLPILITQPRKLATRTVAERVASEMEEKIGGFVDYATSPHKPVSKTAKIIFKMDALVLDQITVDRLLSKYSCLIIDQAHERTISIDVILGLIKELQTKRSKFKVIVTSASLDGKLFSAYFNKKVMRVSGRLYPVEVIHRTFHESDTVRRIEKVIKDDILINGSEMRKEYRGDVLVFCSGVEQINVLCNIFHKYVNPRVFQVYPLHGRIAPNEQRLIFLQTKEHKLIFASRIAETSITINGVKVVVDPGLDREEVYDQKNRVSSRKLVSISQSSAKQRAGRAGRTSKGFCFRLYSQAEMQAFRPNKTPEIQNMALDTLVLRLKMLNVQQIFKFAYINKPDDRALQKSVETLQMIGALSFTGEITTVGRLLLQLRIQPFLGRAIVQAIVCEEIVKKTNYADKELRRAAWKQAEIKRLHFIRQSIVEILSMVINSSNVFTFLNQFDKNRDNLDQVKFSKFSDGRGDFFYLLNIYDEFMYHCQHSQPYELNNWLQSRFLNKKTLFQVKELIGEINETVKNFSFDLKDPSAKKLADIIKIRMTQCKNADDVILSCMMTSFCVNLCLYSNNPNIGYTLILQKKPIAIYGTSTLALLSKFPKWIICYDLKTNDRGVTYCQIAHEVDYDFMKRTVDDQVFDKLNLRQAEKMNPFYETIQRQLPTLILQQIAYDYMNREQLTSEIGKYFKHLSILFDQETNIVSISWPKQLKIQNIIQKPNLRKQTTIKDQLQKYINNKILQKGACCLKFHLMSNVFLEMKDGFIVKDIYFTSKEVQFLAEGDIQLLSAVKNLFQSQNITCKRISKEKLQISTIFQSQYVYVQQWLQSYGLEFRQFVNSKKQQSLNTKIYMKFYTGKTKSGQPIFMYYGKDEKVEEMCDILETCKRQQKKKTTQQKFRYFSILWDCSFKTSKNATGIRCFTKKADAFELKQAIQNLTIFGVLPFNFVVPKNYRQFRETDNLLAIKRQKQWENDIEKVFAHHGFKNISVKVKGDDRFKQQQSQNRRNMEAMMNYELSAELSGESIEVLDELVKKLDGKQDLIGAGKIHFRYNFKQFIIKVNSRAFRALKDVYEYLKEKYQLQSAQLRIQTYERNFGKLSHIFINCRSPNREKLLEPSQKIKQLFTPYILRLESSQFNFLIDSQQGEDFLSRIEEDYSQHIYFGFERKKNQIKIYCDDADFDAISQRILNIFEKYTFCVDKVSYRGKGLNRVTSLIDKQIKWLYQHNQKTKGNKFLQYRIIFKWRQIQLQGDPTTINNIKGEISKLVNEQPGTCHICLKNTEKPYRLFNCDHSFCWKCLGDFIEQSRKEEANGTALLCPEDNCYKPINPFDLRAVLSTEEFESFSMKRLREFIGRAKQYFFCPTSGCDQLFEEASVAKHGSFECFICGKWYCSKCKQPHQHFTCQEWANKLANDQLKKYGFMQCKCGVVLQKEVRQNIIQCKKCSKYLCWICKAEWKFQQDCRNHIRTCKDN